MNARSSVLWLQEVTKNREQILTRQNVIFNFTFVKLKANYYQESSEFINFFSDINDMKLIYWLENQIFKIAGWTPKSC